MGHVKIRDVHGRLLAAYGDNIPPEDTTDGDIDHDIYTRPYNERTHPYAKAPPISENLMAAFRNSAREAIRSSRAFRKRCLHERLDKFNRGECSLSFGDVAAIARQLQEIADAEKQDIQFQTQQAAE